MIKQVIALAIITTLSGCSSIDSNKQKEKEFDEFDIPDIVYPTTVPTEGGIFTSSQNSMMIGVGKAYNIGDIVIVRMEEDIAAQDSTENKTDQKSESSSSIDIPASDLLSQPFGAKLGFSHDQSVEGSGSSKQSHKLEGNIATTVINIYPNGILEIRGKKQITLENGIETVAITGKIREQDISTTDNSVPSSRLADAKIYYRGQGKIFEESQEGWFTNFITGQYWLF